MSRSFNKSIGHALTGLLLYAATMLSPTLVNAGPFEEPVHVLVSYADLDLSQPKGAATLQSRLRSAARVVCGHRPDGRALLRSSIWRKCYEQAIAEAVAKVDRPALTRLYLAGTSPQR